MRTSRLSPIVVAILFVVPSLIFIGCIYYFLIAPANTDAAAFEARYNTAYPDSTPKAQQDAKLDLVKAGVEVRQTQAQWAVIENRIMPRYDVSQRYTAWKQLSTELAFNLGPDLAKYFRSTPGVVPLTAVSLPPPPASPNLVTNAPLVIPISGSSTASAATSGFGGGGAGGGSGSITVGGSFRNILHHVQLWNSFNRLVLVDNLALHGNSPYMSGNYGATVIIFPQNDDKLAPPLVTAPGGTAVGGVPGMPGAPGAM